MSRPRRVLAVFGTRPEAIKLFPLLHALAADDRFASRICVTGQHRAMLDGVLALAGIRPDHDLAVLQPGQSLDQLVARLLTGTGAVLDRESPDLVVVQGDTASAMAGALAAYHRRIPVVHVEAGLRSGDIHQPWPEEVNRRIITTLAALHCAPTERAAAALRAENAAATAVHVTGNTVVDALHWVRARLAAEPALAGPIRQLQARFAEQRIVAVTCHRRENWGAGMGGIATALAGLATRPDVALIAPLHHNPLARSAMQQQLGDLPNVALVEPLDYPAFVHLLDVAHLVLTDSGGVQEEAPALGTPVLVLRETTERPEGIEAGTARLVGTDPDIILAEANRLLDDAAAHTTMARAHNPFGDGQSARRIVELMAQLAPSDRDSRAA
ncbi:UDP-N-acetylglucosamine 2-epimerase [Croceibacterium mercuriale]|uniref:UDP-N-acetylglucosamine 2-epimerase (non-hydrolyzing) n=1 Tax=Croceibacterium mercuriale TaxID=1572751 RepID=A0A0B2BYR3_9SPHN|nr:UDP-N-acetylglucosamine 2-epimerase (non-hydrolyzing) [Croceibacterium mercuriale]KHL24811.1 UDP-N-acetylglucosamine 2-epimerase [Croceibacterium mercuriale]